MQPLYTYGTNYREANEWGKYWVDEATHRDYPVYSPLSRLYHLCYGLYLGFPWCCIKYFLAMDIVGIPAAAYSATLLRNDKEFKNFHEANRAPCRKCIRKE